MSADKEPLPPSRHTLEVYHGQELVFFSDEHWLHPLFAFEDHLARSPRLQPSELEVHDKIVGRAAALLLARLGVGSVHAGLISRLACEVLDRFEIPHRWDRLVDRIACRTEDLLADEEDVERAHAMLAERAGRAVGQSDGG